MLTVDETLVATPVVVTGRPVPGNRHDSRVGRSPVPAAPHAMLGIARLHNLALLEASSIDP